MNTPAPRMRYLDIWCSRCSGFATAQLDDPEQQLPAFCPFCGARTTDWSMWRPAARPYDLTPRTTGG